MLEKFKILQKKDPVFRSTEFFVHETQPSSSTEQSVEPEEPVVIPENDISIEQTVDVVAYEDTYSAFHIYTVTLIFECHVAINKNLYPKT
uniref:Uncharacterized protein n=1 Tax=Caenorhabditis japonica TaxID=281687 RepID=A0A8R1EPC9_CAEJA